MQHSFKAQMEKPETYAGLLHEAQARQQLICTQNVQRHLLCSRFQLCNPRDTTKAHILKQNCRGI
jgi:hypothetical protein